METRGESDVAGSRALRSDAVNRRDDLISGPVGFGQSRTADEGFVREHGVGGESSSIDRPSGTWEVPRSDDGRVRGPVLGTPPYRRDVIMRDQKRKPSAKSKASSGSFDVSVSFISVPVNCKLTTAFMNMLILLHLNHRRLPYSQGLDSPASSRVKHLPLLNGHPPVFSLVTSCSSRSDDTGEAGASQSIGDSSVFLPASLTQLQPAFESDTSTAEADILTPVITKRRSGLSRCSSPHGDTVPDTGNVAFAGSNLVLNGQATLGDNMLRTPNSNRGPKPSRDGHRTLEHASTPPTRKPYGVSKSPLARSKHSQSNYNLLFREFFSSPDGESTGRLATVHGPDSPSRLQLLRSPSTFMVDYAASIPSDSEAGVAYDQILAGSNQPSTSTLEPAFGSEAIAKAGRDVMLADGVDEHEHDMNEIFHLPMPLSSPGREFRLEYQLTPADRSHDEIGPFPASPRPGSSLAVKDALAHGDVDRWLVDHDQDVQPILSTIPPDEYSGNGVIDPFLLSGVAEADNVPPSPALSQCTSLDTNSDHENSEVEDSSASQIRKPSQPPKPMIEPRSPSTRISRAPFRADMVTTDQLILSSDSEDDTSSSSSDSGEYKSKGKGPRASNGPRPRDLVRASARLSFALQTESESGSLPLTAKRGRPPRKNMVTVSDDAELTFCHHCRRKTPRDKMMCTGLLTRGRNVGEPCKKRFCSLCVGKQYVDAMFSML